MFERYLQTNRATKAGSTSNANSGTRWRRALAPVARLISKPGFDLWRLETQVNAH
jgi:hypothetical protein